MTPEEEAREKIDELLKAAGWVLQDRKKLDRTASLGVAVRELHLEAGEVDYALFVNGEPAGVIEAKPEGFTLSGVAEQSKAYLDSIPETLPFFEKPPRFAYESTGVETYFRDRGDPFPRSRPVFAFHKPEILKEWLEKENTLRARLASLPELNRTGLRGCQVEAIEGLEQSLVEARPRALIQMASGAGKTFTAVSFAYRLIKFAEAKRILFLVDRSNLGRQTFKEFMQYATPDDGRKFTELYNVQRLTSNTLDPVCRVVITTIQRLYSMLRGEPELDSELEEKSIFEFTTPDDKEKEVTYNPDIPIEYFDFIVTDECHRSIYNLWRQVLEYFDAFIIGLTATPSKQTYGFFNQNVIAEYDQDRAVADGVNVDYDVYRIQTEITEGGSKVEAGFYVDKRDKLTRKTRWEKLDEDLVYAGKELDRNVVARDQIRTVIKTFKEKLFTEIFPGRNQVPKTLIFAKDDSHAEDIVHIVREEFAKGNEFCKKITYRTTGEKPEDLIASFRNSFNPRIAVTVDMISTGTDVKPLECLLFMRDVKSGLYFEQMKGRGARTIPSADFKAVTPDAERKTHYVIVDAVGVCESDKTDSRPLERKKSVPFEKLLNSIALGNMDEDTLSSIASRLARLDRQIDQKDRAEIEKAADGKSMKKIINDLVDAVDPDKHIEKAKEVFKTDSPTEEQVKKASKQLAREACVPFNNPNLRNTLIDIKKRNEQTIDTVSKDQVIYAGPAEGAKDRAKSTVESFKEFLKKNKDELDALQIIYSKPYGQRHLTYEQIDQLADAIEKPPYNLTPDALWQAYEQLEKSKVRGAGPQRLLTDIISLVRHAIGESEVLEPYHDEVDHRFDKWLEAQESSGREFSPEQIAWLAMIKDHIATSLKIEMDDLELAPFHDKGGPVKAYQLFGEELNKILEELNKVLAA